MPEPNHPNETAPQSITHGSQTFGVEVLVGRIVDHKRRIETQVRGSRENVLTAEIIHDDLIVSDDYGREHIFRLKSWDIACRPGNEARVLWLTHRASSETITERSNPTAISIAESGMTFFKPGFLIDGVRFGSRKGRLALIGAGVVSLLVMVVTGLGGGSDLILILGGLLPVPTVVAGLLFREATLHYSFRLEIEELLGRW